MDVLVMELDLIDIEIFHFLDQVLGTGLGKGVIIFRVDMSSSTKTDNRKNGILILGKGLT